MRIRIKVSSYEECRKEFFLNLKKHAENKIKYWERQKGYRCEIEDNLAEAGAEFEYCQDALNALEKQIPKKATPHKVEAPKIKIGHGYWGKGTTVYKCPCCGTFISYCNYCNKCGQALDWSDTE